VLLIQVQAPPQGGSVIAWLVLSFLAVLFFMYVFPLL
jgi:hypothetical protein